MTDWDALEAAGHDFTMVTGLFAGTSTYYCENCGVLMLIGNEGVKVFHAPKGSHSRPGLCVAEPGLHPTHETLKSKLEELQRQDYERLKEI